VLRHAAEDLWQSNVDRSLGLIGIDPCVLRNLLERSTTQLLLDNIENPAHNISSLFEGILSGK